MMANITMEQINRNIIESKFLDSKKEAMPGQVFQCRVEGEAISFSFERIENVLYQDGITLRGIIESLKEENKVLIQKIENVENEVEKCRQAIRLLAQEIQDTKVL